MNMSFVIKIPSCNLWSLSRIYHESDVQLFSDALSKFFNVHLGQYQENVGYVCF